MMDADRYWAAADQLARVLSGLSPEPKPKPPTVAAAEHLDGGCLLYRLSAARRRTSTGIHDSPIGTHDRATDGTKGGPPPLPTRLRSSATVQGSQRDRVRGHFWHYDGIRTVMAHCDPARDHTH
jgi:hypothetical protein